ncbi:MAG TPA: hypothetical protein VHE78_08870 [Gemmatimonadaceae bacterium]|nr:hypothetical protein [Gemmatimonadaceae bacterium]
MLIWLLAVALGAALAVLQYHLGGELRTPLLIALRAIALAIILALVLDAASGPARSVRPYAALDASESWLATGDSALWRRAVRSADSVGADTVLLVGDSVRTGPMPGLPRDGASRVAPLVERALGAGRPVTFVTDGRLDDPDRLADLPAGSHVVTLEGAARPDAAIVSLDGPAAVVTGDTVQFMAVVSAGAAGARAGRLDLSLGGTSLVASPVDSMAPFAEREVRLRSAIGGVPGMRLLRAVLTTPGDEVPSNDTLLAVIEVAQGASAVFVSTVPDYDARYALDVLRGTLAIPTRGYFRVAPGQWRVDGALSPVSEDEVRRSVSAAPLAVLHGDTALFGPPRALTKGALALIAPPAQHGDDYYAVGAPLSPLTAALGGLPWDSLPPVELGEAGRDAEWVAISARRGRRFDERPLVSGSSHPRRIVVVPATGLWRWKFRGGRSADAFTAIWGSVFDWMTGDATDVRAAHPAVPWIRAGEPVRWRRGSAHDSTATVVIRARGGTRSDTLHLRFAGETGVAESPPLPRGIYDTHAQGGDGLLAVNVSAEWLPRRQTVRAGAVGTAPSADRAPRARTAWWLYALALAALCTEWVRRRKIGLR